MSRVLDINNKIPLTGILISVILHALLILGTFSLWNTRFEPPEPFVIDVEIFPELPSLPNSPALQSGTISTKPPSPEAPVKEPVTEEAVTAQAKKTSLESPQKRIIQDDAPNESLARSPSQGSASGDALSGAGAVKSASAEYAQNPKPPYPESARRAKKEGTVRLLVTVSQEGTVNAVSISESSGVASLDDSAQRTVKRWHFKPAMLDGAPIQAQVEIPIRFALN